jgi:hypothetical protein
MPPTPSGFSRLWLGPATKPSSDMDMWQVVAVMASQIDTNASAGHRPIGTVTTMQPTCPANRVSASGLAPGQSAT